MKCIVAMLSKGFAVIRGKNEKRFFFNSQFLHSLQQFPNLPVNIAILNNCYLGVVRQWQELFYKKRYSHTCLKGGCPDFVGIAEAYGAVGIRVDKKDDVRPAIDKAIATKNTVVLDFIVDEEENVFPMVPAGEAINRMIGGMA